MAKLTDSVLVSRIGTYNNKMSSHTRNEFRVKSNLTTTAAGCYFFSHVTDGVDTINFIVSLVVYVLHLRYNFKK